MKRIQIGNTAFDIKDYYCSQSTDYLPKEDGRLWLYVNMTDVCPASCPFCVNPGRKHGSTRFDLQIFQDTLRKISHHVYGISFTGGEPMLEPELLDEAILSAEDIMGPEVELDLVTNGINLMKVSSFTCLNYLDSIHLSRHRISDDENKSLMGIDTPSKNQIQDFISRLQDPSQLVLNCVLSKNGVCSVETIAAYLEMAADLDVRNTSFIGMIKANEYCKQHYINPAMIHVEEDSRFRIWNRFHDHEYCSCLTGDYLAKKGWVRFYYRAPGMKTAPYARQIVYNHDNVLLSGFGGDEIQI